VIREALLLILDRNLALYVMLVGFQMPNKIVVYIVHLDITKI
jgi:hypothetical protein